MDQWRSILDQAFRSHNFELDHLPLIGPESELIHFEAPVRLNWDGQKLPAGQFLPWVNRLQLSSELDMEVVDLALKSIAETGKPTAVNLSIAAVVETAFVSWIGERLTQKNELAQSLWLEVPEAMAFRHLKNFKLLCGRARSSGKGLTVQQGQVFPCNKLSFQAGPVPHL